jgi:hypothetical protein
MTQSGLVQVYTRRNALVFVTRNMEEVFFRIGLHEPELTSSSS